MRSLVLASWSIGGKSSGRNGSAKRGSGGRTEGAVLSQVVYGDDDVRVVEIAMQVGAGMQAGRREAAGH